VGATLRSLGRLDGTLYLLDRGLARLSGGGIRIHRYLLVAQPLENGVPLPGRRGAGFAIRELKAGEPQPVGMVHSAATLDWRFGQRARCLAAFKGEELAGFIWWVEGAYREDEVACRFLPRPEGRAVWDFDLYIAPHYRMTPLFLRLWDAASRELHAAGYRWACSRVSAFNPGSLRAHRRLGARVVGQRLFLRLGALELSTGSQPPRIGRAWAGRGGPEIPVAPS